MRISIFLLFGLMAWFLSACSTPAVAEFSATSNSGNAPHEVTFVLGELADADSYSWDFGDGAGSTELEPAHTFQDAGTFTVRLTATRGESVVVAETSIVIEAGEAGWVVIDGGEESLISFESTQYTAMAFDVLGNTIQDPVFRWSVDPAAGDIDDSGMFTAGTDLGNFESAISVEIERLGVVVTENVGLEVIKGPLHTFSIEPNTLDLQVGRAQKITVQAVDEAGHDLDRALLLFTPVRAGDSVDASGLFTAGTLASEQSAELMVIEVELNGKVIEATVTGTVNPGILDEVHVSVLPTSLVVGETYQLVSFATDRFGNKIELDEIQWSVSHPGIGTVTESGLFTAGTAAGSHVKEGIIARGILNNVESVTLARVTISAGSVASIHIVPESDSVPIGAGSPYTVLALDEHGNVLEIAEDQYEYAYSTAGRGSEVAVFIAGYEIGDFDNAITVTLPAGAFGNDSALIAQADISVRQRSSNIVAIEVIDQDGGGIFFIDLETAQLGSADLSFHNNDAVELSPAWWPDGSRLVYVSDPTGELQVYTLHLATREIVQLTDIAGGASMPDISHNGDEIVFVSLANDNWQLYVASILDDVGTNPITLEDSLRISDDVAAQHILPSWSPDGTQILTSQNTPDGLVRIMLFDPKAEAPSRIIGPFGSVGFGWNSDGSGVHVGLATSGGALDLGTLDIASGDVVFIESTLGFLVASWAPDDSELVAIDSLLGAGWLVDSDGTGLRRIVSS
ncbi:MAG: PKD domain-containing protein, partial [Dehalococcoidia bacterium]